MAAMLARSLLLSSLCIFIALAQQPADPLKDFCRRYGHQTAVIGRKLYIDGGWLYANPISQNPIPTMNQGLSYSDLDQLYENMPRQYANLTKNSSVPDVAGGILWQDEVNQVFWLYGGEFAAAPSAFQLWGYDIVLDEWIISPHTPNSTPSLQRVSYGAGVAVSESGKGFYYGGYLNNLTNPLWTAPQIATSNLIVYDMDSNSFTNNTGYDNIGKAEGTMVFIPASGSGLLIYFGGATFPYGNGTEEGASMDTIQIYDIAKWYTQRATGQIPETRRKSCGGATWPEDQSSYNVYIYGGFGFGENATGYDDVYILTMPAFEWIKWYPEKPGPGAPHGDLTCNVIGNAQMIVMAGNFTNTTACDVPSIQGQHNLNLGQYGSDNAKWYPYLLNLTEYFVPPAIVQVAGGTSSGGATKKSPTNGWDDPRLSVYFTQKAAFASRSPTRTLPTQTAAPAPPTATPHPSENRNIGAITGGSIGGLAILVTAILAAWFLLKKNRKTHPAEGAPGPTGRYVVPRTPGTHYVVGEKHAAVGSPNSTSRVGSPSDHVPPQQPDLIQHPSTFNAPLPMNPEYPYYYHYPQPPMHYYPFPAQPNHGHPSPGVYPPPDIIRPNVSPPQSHEMPTTRSPEIVEMHQPMPSTTDSVSE